MGASFEINKSPHMRRRYILSRIKDLFEATERPETLAVASCMLGGGHGENNPGAMAAIH